MIPLGGGQGDCNGRLQGPAVTEGHRVHRGLGDSEAGRFGGFGAGRKTTPHGAAGGEAAAGGLPGGGGRMAMRRWIR